ncbi:HXXEE domain-containing protein [Lysinibacillus xylanilyticus]|uniref:HXXEE domain-containing protein n=1 Tax=Lysinibacillus xylanilyticus TaxID=582475 RepID=UPI003CFFB219
MEALAVFFCLAITLHNIEEAIWLPQWSQHGSKFQKTVTPNEFHFAVFVITALAYLSAFFFIFLPQSNFAKWFFVGFLGAMIINAIFPHLLTTIVMKKYAPGLVTALLLNIPINSLIIHRMFETYLIEWTELLFSTILVGISLLALIPFLFKLGRLVSPILKP